MTACAPWRGDYDTRTTLRPVAKMRRPILNILAILPR
jgi:hypothetical protein